VSLNANSLTVDTSGTASFPVEDDEPQAATMMYLVPQGPVILLGHASATDPGCPLPANVPVPVPGRGGFLRAPSATVVVGYYYLTNTGG
jgi:hypothetical protein